MKKAREAQLTESCEFCVGTLPARWSNMTGLHSLDLHGNELEGGYGQFLDLIQRLLRILSEKPCPCLACIEAEPLCRHLARELVKHDKP